MRKFRIAHLGAGNSPHLHVLARELSLRGHELTIISGTNYQPFPEIENVTVCSFDSTRRFDVKIRAIREILAARKIEILHSHYVNHGGFAAALTAFHPHVLSAWGDDILLTPQESFAKKLMVTGALLTADLVLPVSNALGDEITRLTSKKVKPVTWHWGVDGGHFAYREKEAQKFRESLGLTSNDLIVYSPRLLWPDYYHDVLLEAWPKVLQEFPGAKLVLKRTGENKIYENKLRALSKSLGIESSLIWIESLPYSELPTSYAAADVVVSLPLTEGTPITILETLACETIVVAADIPAVRHWVEERKTGFLTPLAAPEVAQALVKALKLSRDERKHMGQEGRTSVLKRAERKICFDRLEEIYSGIATEPHFSLATTLLKLAPSLK